MSTVTLPKVEYERLKRYAEAYRHFATNLFEFVIQDPLEEVIKDFASTGLYSQDFLDDLEKGLEKSSYFRRYANQAARKRSSRIS